MSENEHLSQDPSYFEYYGMLANQQNMLLDTVRTSSYQKAIMDASSYFKDKIVLDVGCGSGILSFFAAHAGARHVYAVEGSAEMAKMAMKLVEGNKMSHKITVMHGLIEKVELPVEKVDILISEPIGILLLHERMCESYVRARMKYLPNPGIQNMYPSGGRILLAPFTDTQLYADTVQRCTFWTNDFFHGIDLSCLHQDAISELFGGGVIGGIDPKSLLAKPYPIVIDFTSVALQELREIERGFALKAEYTGVINGLAGWFDFQLGTELVISTAPNHPRTHWHQVRFLFQRPLAVNYGTLIDVHFRMIANKRRSFDIQISMQVGDVVHVQHFRLQDQHYHNLGGFTEVASAENLGLSRPF